MDSKLSQTVRQAAPERWYENRALRLVYALVLIVSCVVAIVIVDMAWTWGSHLVEVITAAASRSGL